MAAADETILGVQRPPAQFVFENGETAGARIPVAKHQLVLGRDESSADIVLKDRMVSRRHARISWMAIEFIIEDLNSSNGTLLTGSNPAIELKSVKTPYFFRSARIWPRPVPQKLMPR